MGCHFLPQGIFLTQGLNPSLLHLLYRRWMLYPLSHQGSLEWTNEYEITFQYYPEPYVTKHGSHISKGLLVWVHPESVNIFPLQNFLSFLHLIIFSSLISAKILSLEWHFYLRQESDPTGLYWSRQKAERWPLHQPAYSSFPPPSQARDTNLFAWKPVLAAGILYPFPSPTDEWCTQRCSGSTLLALESQQIMCTLSLNSLSFPAVC